MRGARLLGLPTANGLSRPAATAMERACSSYLPVAAARSNSKAPSLDPVWSPRGDLIVYCGTQLFTRTPLLAVRPDGTPEKLPEITLQREGERARFLPDGSGLVYMLGSTLTEQDFWLLDLSTMRSRRLTRLSNAAVMRAFDITPDGRRIVFDRSREMSNIVLIDLATKPRPDPRLQSMLNGHP